MTKLIKLLAQVGLAAICLGVMALAERLFPGMETGTWLALLIVVGAAGSMVSLQIDEKP